MALRAAARALARNKLRSILTMLGIFIGVAALIAMVAVGQGANEAVEEQIASLGTNLLIVMPGATTANGVRAGFGSVSTLTVGDAEEIMKHDWPVARVSYLDRQLAQVEYNRQNWSTNVQGVTPSYLPIRNWTVVEGRPLDEEDERSAARVCLLGQTVVSNLFGEHTNPVGAMVRVKSVDMQVVGVLAAKGQSGWGQDQDDVVLIPFSTAERKVLGVAAPPAASPSGTATPSVANPYAGVPTASSIYSSDSAQTSPFGSPPKLTGVVHNIFVQAKSEALIPQAMDQVIETLHNRHHIQPGQDNDFDVRNLSEVAQAAEGSSRIMALLLATVASISLLVGGIGIMNILLVSVTERTREIGIRMAIGARRVHILLQFLVEAILLGMVGGAGGITRRHRSVAGDFVVRRMADAALARRDRRRLSVFRGGRNIFRLLSGAQGFAAQSDRRAALRIDETASGPGAAWPLCAARSPGAAASAPQPWSSSRSTYGRIPPWRMYSTSSGVSIRASTSNSRVRPPSLTRTLSLWRRVTPAASPSIE